jgi:hypothetical protein
MFIDFNQVSLSGIVSMPIKNISKNAAKVWYAVPLILWDKMSDGQPYYQCITVHVYDGSKNEMISGLQLGDRIMVQGKMSIKTSVVQGVYKTEFKVVNTLGMPIVYVSSGNELPAPKAAPHSSAPSAGYNAHRAPQQQQPAPQTYSSPAAHPPQNAPGKDSYYTAPAPYTPMPNDELPY